MVFSNDRVVAQIQNRFVPIALKAAHVNQPPRGVEGRLFAEIGRSKPAPQGICVVNSAGKALVWALSFDSDDSISEFLDYAEKRFREHPDAGQPVVAERFMRFPSQKLPDVADTGVAIDIPLSHSADEHCPALPLRAEGDLVGRIIGRALDEDGQPVADTRRQEHYLESRFEFSGFVQRQFVESLRKADGEKFSLPESMIRALVGAAFLGPLDVNPLGSLQGSQNDTRAWEFFGEELVAPAGQFRRIRITGYSDLTGSQKSLDFRADGRLWSHAVSLDWQGYLELDGDQVKRLTLLAEGHEKLRWGNVQSALYKDIDARHLMAGHAIDLDTDVRYGLTVER